VLTVAENSQVRPVPHRKRRREQLRRAEEDETGNYSDDVSLGRLSHMGNDFRFGPPMLL
jgi:hypothetical protein